MAKEDAKSVKVSGGCFEAAVLVGLKKTFPVSQTPGLVCDN